MCKNYMCQDLVLFATPGSMTSFLCWTNSLGSAMNYCTFQIKIIINTIIILKTFIEIILQFPNRSQLVFCADFSSVRLS